MGRVCTRMQMGQVPDLDVLLGPIAVPPPPPPEPGGDSGTTPVFRTEVTAPYAAGGADWMWLAMGVLAIVAVSRRR